MSVGNYIIYIVALYIYIYVPRKCKDYIYVPSSAANREPYIYRIIIKRRAALNVGNIYLIYINDYLYTHTFLIYDYIICDACVMSYDVNDFPTFSFGNVTNTRQKTVVALVYPHNII